MMNTIKPLAGMRTEDRIGSSVLQPLLAPSPLPPATTPICSGKETAPMAGHLRLQKTSGPLVFGKVLSDFLLLLTGWEEEAGMGERRWYTGTCHIQSLPKHFRRVRQLLGMKESVHPSSLRFPSFPILISILHISATICRLLFFIPHEMSSALSTNFCSHADILGLPYFRE